MSTIAISTPPTRGGVRPDAPEAQAGAPAVAPRFHRLVVADVRRETPDAVSVAFAVPPELASAYRFEPGQYLTLRATIEGEEVRRSYSICSGPGQELRIGVKRVGDGLFSSWMNDAVHAGDEIDVLTPTGRFGLQNDPGDSRVHIGFAAGSGITPILSIARGVLAGEPNSCFFLFYGNRSIADMMFRQDLEELKDLYLGRFSVFHVLSKEQRDLSLLNGRLDGEKVRLFLSAMIPAEAVDHAFVCGPSSMIDDIEGALRDVGLSAEKIHVERFVSALGGRPRPKPVIAPEAPPRQVASLIVDGKRRDVPVADGESILDAALRAGMDLPFACKGGMCSTCRAKVVEGAAEMDVNYSLERWELKAGFVLTCQARPKSKRIVIDFDQI